MTALFSTAYLPPVSYVAKIMQHTDIQIETKETFPKQTYRNRTIIMTANGIMSLSVPVLRDNHSRTEEVRIDYKERWNVIHLRTLTAAYSASPFFLYYKDALESLLMKRYDRLVDLNQSLLTWLLKCMKTDCNIEFTSEWQSPGSIPDDYRNVFSPKKATPLPCQFPTYYQVFSDRFPFAPDLSIIDLLMNLGPEARDYLKKIC